MKNSIRNIYTPADVIRESFSIVPVVKEGMTQSTHDRVARESFKNNHTDIYRQFGSLSLDVTLAIASEVGDILP
jgi:hypothetical protein